MVIPVPIFKVPRCAGYGPRASISCRRDATWEVLVYIREFLVIRPPQTVHLCDLCMGRFWKIRANRTICERKRIGR